MGRPRIQIEKDQFIKLCGLQCTLEEIASWFGCSGDTIERWCLRELGTSYAEAYKKHSASGKISLRRYQFNLAKTSAAMAIFLGKNILGQTDNPLPQSDANDLLTALQGYAKALVDK